MILVTGGTGLVGSHLLYELTRAGHKVKAFIRKTSTRQNVEQTFSFYANNKNELLSNIQWVEGDILDYDSVYYALENVAKVYHAAAMVSFNPSNKKKILKTNIEGTANIINASLEKRIKKFCYISSVATLSSSEKNELVTENFKCKFQNNSSVYSLSKLKAEQEVWRGINEGLNAVIVNPSIIIGPGNWDKSSAKLFSTIWNGLKYYPPGGMGFVDVKDVVHIMIALMESNCSGEQYIVSAENCTYQEFFNYIADCLGKKRPSVKVTPFLAGLGVKLEWLKSFILFTEREITKEITKSGFAHDYFNNNKIKEAINFNFMPIKKSIEDNCKIFMNSIINKPSTLPKTTLL